MLSTSHLNKSPIPTNFTPFSLPHQSVSSLSLSFSLIDPLSTCRNHFSLCAIFSKEESSFVDFTDARKKGFPTAPIKTHFRYASISPQSLFILIETYVKFCPLRMCMLLDCVCMSNFGVGVVGFGFNRVDRFVNFIWVLCFFFFFFVFNSYWYIFYWFLVLILLIVDFWV